MLVSRDLVDVTGRGVTVVEAGARELVHCVATQHRPAGSAAIMFLHLCPLHVPELQMQ